MIKTLLGLILKKLYNFATQALILLLKNMKWYTFLYFKHVYSISMKKC